MSVIDVCHYYFTLTPRANQKTHKWSHITLTALKILSYFTIIIPLIMGMVYAAAILHRRVSQYQSNSRLYQINSHPPEPYKNAPSLIQNPTDPVIKNLKTIKEPVFPPSSTHITSPLTPSGAPPDPLGGNQPTICGFLGNGINIQRAGESKRRLFTNVALLPSPHPSKQVTNWEWSRAPSNPMTWYTTGMRKEDLPPLVHKWVKKKKLDILIFGTGRGKRGAPLQANTTHQGALIIQQDLQDYVKRAGVEVHVCNTAEAVRQYNQFCKAGKRVGALLHPAFHVSTVGH
jgi:hypothetical protein